MTTTVERLWWASLKHGGLLVTPGRIAEYFEAEPPTLSRYLEDRLRRDVFSVLEGGDGNTARLLDTLFEQVLEYPRERWSKGSAVSSDWTRRAVTGEAVKPRRLWQGKHGEVLPVFIPDAETLGEAHRLGVGRGRKTVSRVVEWLRLTDRKLAILTNGHQLRLIHAGPDYEAWCEWDLDLWFQEGVPGHQVEALRSLLHRRIFESPDSDTPGILLTAIMESRKGQAELSATLGENVRRAVELLIDASREVIDPLDDTEQRDDVRRAIYIAATRLIMRMVVILFAESRELLPRDNPIYHSSYGLQGLRDQLERTAGGRGADRLRHSCSAWPRLLSLFRLIYTGSRHEAMVVQSYGGGLFQPGNALSSDPLLRALAALENPANAINDAQAYGILKLLTRSRVFVRQGRRLVPFEAPVDFSDLSTEYIGILYEGLLDFELRRADTDDPTVFLSLGDQPALPFSRLDGMDDKTLQKLLEKTKKSTKKTSSDEDEADDDEDGDQEEEAVEELEYEAGSEADFTEPDLLAAEPSDVTSYWNDKVTDWACRAAIAAKLIKSPRNRRNSDDSEYRSELSKTARQIIYKTVLPGDWFLVRWGGTRKGAGTFYTRPQLAGPTTRRTLEPLIYEDIPGEGKRIRKPEEILSIKVCDPAMGSGSFLVSALRILVDALFESLHFHGRLTSGGDRTVCRLADGLPADDPRHETLPVPINHEDFEIRLKARLKRHVVERCIYGVDIDPLAVELARMSLWVETMDRNLPFHFLDHKLKCGNSLVGCWFDRFQDYPVMAWEREGGDKNHDNFVHHFHTHESTRGKTAGQVTKKGDKWTQAIKDYRDNVIKPEMKAWISAHAGDVFSFMKEGYTTGDLHHDIRKSFEELHEIPVHEEANRAALYREQILNNPDFIRLKTAFDTWCAIWFWPGDLLEQSPTPRTILSLPDEACEIVETLARKHRFFHWEIEFPDVFTGPESGFDAVVGNPPWEIQKPNSKEFFSNHDPLYRAYGKQEGLRKQSDAFSSSSGIEDAWIEYNASLKSLSNFAKNASYPFGDAETGGDTFNFSRASGENKSLHHLWRKKRSQRRGFSDPEHPFRHQGSADINTYKMFLEAAHALSQRDGLFGFIVPSGIYTDKGSTSLRDLFLEKCRWEWLFGFENRDKLFDIDSRFKFCPVIVRKGGTTQAIRAAFMRRSLLDWEDAEKHVLLYPRDRVEQFSPNSKAILEIRHPRDLEILEKLYANGVLLGDEGPDGWGIEYAREFDMTNDSKLFPPRPWWEERGYIPDEYGHWLKGAWRPVEECGFVEGRSKLDPHWKHWSILDRPRGLVVSRDGKLAVLVDEIEDVALPLYQGVMIWHYDFSFKGWSGSEWEHFSWNNKHLQPRFLLGKTHLNRSGVSNLAIRDIAATTNQRTMISAVIAGFPCGNKVPLLGLSGNSATQGSAVLNSLSFDWVQRLRQSGTTLNRHILSEQPLIHPDESGLDEVNPFSIRLSLVHCSFSSDWMSLRTPFSASPWRLLWAITPHERLRLRCILDAVVADLYGLDEEDFRWILSECDYPLSSISVKGFVKSLNQKGFWRVDKDKDPELRHTVLSLVAFHDLKEKGMDTFLAQNDGEGWMLPETLRLADYGLGHDERASEQQPVASRLGPRFLPWQLEQSVEESWEECARHAELIDLILKGPSSAVEPSSGPPTDLLGQPLESDLFGNASVGTRRGRRGR
jgi:hypothetical protein